MPISKTTGYRASDGVVYATVEEAQRAELARIFNAEEINVNPEAAADVVLQHADAILAILTTGPRSRPRARKAAGTTNPRRAVRTKPAERERATPEAAGAAFKEMHAAVDAA